MKHLMIVLIMLLLALGILCKPVNSGNSSDRTNIYAGDIKGGKAQKFVRQN